MITNWPAGPGWARLGHRKSWEMSLSSEKVPKKGGYPQVLTGKSNARGLAPPKGPGGRRGPTCTELSHVQFSAKGTPAGSGAGLVAPGRVHSFWSHFDGGGPLIAPCSGVRKCAFRAAVGCQHDPDRLFGTWEHQQCRYGPIWRTFFPTSKSAFFDPKIAQKRVFGDFPDFPASENR